MIPGIVAGAPVTPALSIDREVGNGRVMIAHRGCSFIRPETTDVAYDAAVLAGQYNLEADVWVNASSSLVISHDINATYVTTSTANYSTLNDAAVAALTVDAATWFGATFAGINVPLFRDVAAAHLGDAIFWTEIKDGTSGTRMVNELTTATVPLNQACVSSFVVGDMAPATAAGYRTKLLGTTSSVLATAQANNIDFVAYRKDASASLFSTAAAAGVPSFAYTINRRIERDAMFSAGAIGMYSDDPKYVGADTPSATTDNFAAQTWMLGMIPGAVASESRPTLAERGRFFSSDYWGFSETADTKSFVLQGWACPIKGDPGADNFTIDLKITFDANNVAGTTRWAGLHIASEAFMDRDYNNEATGNEGYAVAFRKNGVIDLFREDTSGFTSIGTSAGTAITTGTEHRFTVVVSPTQIIVNRHNSGGTIIQTTTGTDSTYRGGYFHLGKFGLACKFRDIIIT